MSSPTVISRCSGRPSSLRTGTPIRPRAVTIPLRPRTRLRRPEHPIRPEPRLAERGTTLAAHRPRRRTRPRSPGRPPLSGGARYGALPGDRPAARRRIRRPAPAPITRLRAYERYVGEVMPAAVPQPAAPPRRPADLHAHGAGAGGRRAPAGVGVLGLRT